MSSENDKWELLKPINAIKRKGVFARLDLTKEEQHKDFLLRQELKEQREKDPQGQYKIIKNKIVKLD